MAYGDDTPRRKLIKQALELAKTDEDAANNMLIEGLKELPPPVMDWRVGNAAILAESNSDAAAERLQLAAIYLRELDHHFPYGLGRFLADAFDIAALKKTPQERAKALAEELQLTARNRRPVSPYVGSLMWSLVESGLSQSESAKNVARKYNVSSKTANRAYLKEKAIRDWMSRPNDVEN
jgi:hypothetical protein